MEKLGKSNLPWNFKPCTENIFPFNKLSDDELFECMFDILENIKNYMINVCT